MKARTAELLAGAHDVIGRIDEVSQEHKLASVYDDLDRIFGPDDGAPPPPFYDWVWAGCGGTDRMEDPWWLATREALEQGGPDPWVQHRAEVAAEQARAIAWEDQRRQRAVGAVPEAPAFPALPWVEYDPPVSTEAWAEIAEQARAQWADLFHNYPQRYVLSAPETVYDVQPQGGGPRAHFAVALDGTRAASLTLLAGQFQRSMERMRPVFDSALAAFHGFATVLSPPDPPSRAESARARRVRSDLRRVARRAERRARQAGRHRSHQVESFDPEEFERERLGTWTEVGATVLDQGVWLDETHLWFRHVTALPVVQPARSLLYFPVV